MRRLLAGTSFLAVMAAGASASAEDSPPLFSQASFWVQGNNLSVVNYRSGTKQLTIGTRVRVKDKGAKGYTCVELDTGNEFMVLHHKSWDTDIEVPFKRFFAPEDPLQKLTQLTAQDRKLALTGSVERGMHKDAVLLALGPPPPHKTPDLAGQTWTYWKDKFATFQVKFNDRGIVVALPGLEAQPEVAPEPEGPKDLRWSKTNLRIIDGDTIDWLNFQTGPVLPVNTQVDVLSKSESEVKLRVVESGKVLTYEVDAEAAGRTAWQMFETVFAKGDQRAALAKLKGDQKAALAAEVKVGMHKNAVLVALGPPPPHKTTALAASSWLYWSHRNDTFRVHFSKKDRVVRVEE
jgi:outer membrane protein assembly factor BamE (lipoprotein component of BamABCDE complex)